MKHIVLLDVETQMEALTNCASALDEIVAYETDLGEELPREFFHAAKLVHDAIVELAKVRYRLRGPGVVPERMEGTESLLDVLNQAAGTLELVRLEWVEEPLFAGQRFAYFRVVRKEGETFTLHGRLKDGRSFVVVGDGAELAQTFKLVKQ
jgi:hypothetical protein